MDIHQGMFLNGDKIFVPQRGAASLANMCSDAIRTFSAVRNVVIKDGMATGIQTDDGGSFVSWYFLRGCVTNPLSLWERVRVRAHPYLNRNEPCLFRP